MSQITSLPQLSVSVEEAVRLSIYEVMAQGDLKTFKIGKRRLILMTELRAWIERAAKAGAR
jgi:hypothetical protein